MKERCYGKVLFLCCTYIKKKCYFFVGAEVYGFVGILENFVICYN
jgi:hypothetical protein